MAIITPTPLYLDDCIVSIDGNDYAAAVNSATFTPNAAVARFRGLKATANYKHGTTDWNLDLNYVQDWDAEAPALSLSQFLHDNEGETIEDVSFRPSSGTGDTFTADIVIVPGSIGGTAEQFGAVSVSLGCVAKPVRTPAA